MNLYSITDLDVNVYATDSMHAHPIVINKYCSEYQLLIVFLSAFTGDT